MVASVEGSLVHILQFLLLLSSLLSLTCSYPTARIIILKVYLIMMQNFFSLCKRAFKMIRMVLILSWLVAQSSKILFYANQGAWNVTRWTQNVVKSKRTEDLFCVKLKLCAVILIAKFHDMSTVTFSWQHKGLQALSAQRVKLEFYTDIPYQ